MSKLLTMEELKGSLDVKDLSHLSKDKVIELCRLIPKIERGLSIEVIRGLDNKREIALDVIKHLNILCEEAISNNYELEVIRGYQKTLDSLDYMIREGGASFEDQEYCRQEIIKIAARIGINEDGFTDGLIGAAGGPIGLVILIGVAILGSYK